MTRSGRISSSSISHDVNTGALDKAKGKQVVVNDGEPLSNEKSDLLSFKRI